MNIVTSIGRLLWKHGIRPQGRVRNLLTVVQQSAAVIRRNSAHAPRTHHCPRPHAHPRLSSFSLRTHSHGKRRESSSTGALALPLQRRPLKNAYELNKTLPLCPHPSVESHSVVMMFLETLLPWVKMLHLQITAFGLPAKKWAELMTTWN